MAALRSVFLAAALGSAVLAMQPVQALAAEAVAAAPSAAAVELSLLAERFYEAQARFDPVRATIFGDNRYDDQLPMTIQAPVRARMFAMLHGVVEDLMRIDRSKLAGDDLITYDLLNFEMNQRLRFESLKDHLLPLNHMDSLPVVLANFGSGKGSQPIATYAQYQMYLKRIAALPEWIDAAIGNMQIGMKDNIVQPKALMLSLLPQIRKLAAATPATSDFNAARHMPDSFSAGEKARLKGDYLQVVSTRVLPSLRKLAAFLENDYLPATRASSGWGGLPNGAQWYRAWVATHTTTDMTPDEIHRIGLAEVARIHAEFVKLAPKLGYTGAPQGLPRWLALQPQYRPFKTEEEVLQAYRQLNARIVPKLPQLFGSLPTAPLELRAEPELSRATASDHYTLAAADGSRPGIFWAVIPDAANYGSTRMTSLFLHEGMPGHHFQLSKQQALPLPKFRKFGLINAYSEGWGLYAETLGKELGLYDDPNAYAGFLILDLRRAARLVVDTGLHAKGWSREQTIAYLMDAAGDSEADARNATERYMAWPGQALSYKIGALKIMALRQRAAAALGPRFSLAAFHDEVLAHGPMPLALLEARIDSWIASQMPTK
jgi:uncharacterized protein (DUF885 family)